MKKLADFKDEAAVDVVARLLPHVLNIAANANTAAAREKGGNEFLSAMLRNSPSDTMALLAILSEEEPEEYHCTGASVMQDVMGLILDRELMQLFGLQSKTTASSGSASESTEAQNQ